MKPITAASSSAMIKVRGYNRLRDEFAMAALTGLLAARSYDTTDGLVYAATAYTLADAMLKQREAS